MNFTKLYSERGNTGSTGTPGIQVFNNKTNEHFKLITKISGVTGLYRFKNYFVILPYKCKIRVHQEFLANLAKTALKVQLNFEAIF